MKPTSTTLPVPSNSGSPPLRRLSLAEHRFDAYTLFEPDPELVDLLENARERIGAQFAAIDILTPSRRLRIAGSPEVDLGSAELRWSLAHEVFRTMADVTVFHTRDVNDEPLLRRFVREMGGSAEVHFYAAAPLVDDGRVLLGALCMWSDHPRTLAAKELETLAEATEHIVEVLTARHTAAHHAAAASGNANGISNGWDINRIIDEQAIRTVFQPIVRLDTQEVVGFEALSRGPEGSALETPIALIEAANAAGRLGELDWLCRVRAVERAANSGLAPSLAWFINVEPAGLAIPCPEHLRPAWARAREQIRMVLEIVERDADVNVIRLVRASEQARENTWGVALDDVGAEPISLALLPVLQPDVIKLDMSLLHGVDHRTTASTIAAINAYAEEHGAVVLAEGVECREHEELAKAFGAQYGQGYKYGLPGDLPEALPAPRSVVPLTQKFEPPAESNPWNLLAAARPSSHAPKEAVLAVRDVMQQLVLGAREPGLALMCVGDVTQLTAEVRERHRAITAASALTMVLGKGLIPNVRRGYRSVRLPPGSELARYGMGIILTVDDAAALIVQNCSQFHGDRDDCLEYLYTTNRNLVVAAARALITATGQERGSDLFDTGDDSEMAATDTIDGDDDDRSSESSAGDHRSSSRLFRRFARR